MQESSGDPRSRLWLVADSPPPQWETLLREPLDPRHPARHNIWTPIADVIQEEAYQKKGWRMDEGKIYVRNAVSSATAKPERNADAWGPETSRHLTALAALAKTERPPLIVTFGAFAFEFVRRFLGEAETRRFGHWTTKTMGEQMRRRMGEFSPDRTNILPALHATIARGRFLESHRDYCAGLDDNYFLHVGQQLSKVLIDHADRFDVFLRGPPTA
jgi:hypothetical protein